MPLDHFVSQVHLRNFYTENERLIGVNKNTLKKFCARSEDVCRIPDGSTNEYLTEPRVVEEFLKNIEPKYNSTVAALRDRRPDVDSIYVISGFIAYIMTCSPTAMRIGKPFLSASVQTFTERLEKRGELQSVPEELGTTSISQLMDSGLVEINVDGKYPQAIGISNILASINSFGNAFWEVIHIDDKDSGFFTSDFPIAFGPSNDHRVVSKTVPLAPDIAIRIHPRIPADGLEQSFSFETFSVNFKRIKYAAAREINRQIVRSAEDIVFYNRNQEWIVPFVKKNRNYRSETIVDRIPAPNGTFISATQRVKQFAR